MMLKQIVGVALIVFGSVVALLLFVGLVLTRPLPPGLGLVSQNGVAPGGAGNVVTPAPGAVTDPGSGSGPAASAAPGAIATPAPGATPKPGTTATPTPAPGSTPKPGGGGSTPTPTPGGTPTPPPVHTPTPTPTPAPTPTPTPCGSAGGSCTAAQVATHNSAANCWVIYGGWYYIVTSYVSSHPGGVTVFNSSTCGHDISSYLSGAASTAGQQHSHSGTAYAVLNSYKVGPVN